ncbi:MAG: AI-2E family transporter [Fimbriimonadaceae bacterium]
MHQVTFPIPSTIMVRNWFLKLALGAFVLYLAYVVREIWLPLGLALILAMVLDPVVDRMELRGWSRTWATAFIFGSFLLITIGLCILAFPYVGGQASEMQAQFAKYFPDHSQAGLLKSFRHMNVPESAAQLAAHAYQSLATGLEQSGSSLAGYGMQFAGNLIWVVIIPIVTFYTLRDFNVILAKALLVVPAPNRPLVQTAVSDVTIIFGKYLRGLGLVSILNGIATGILLEFVRVPSAILLGLIAGVLYSVPYVGAILTVALTAAVAFIGGGMHLMLVAVGTSVILHQVIFDQIVTPRILGSHVGLHPILSIVALLAGNLLLGIIGMILAVPIAACIQIAVLTVLPKLAIDVEITTPGSSHTIDAEAPNESDETKTDINTSEQMKAAVNEAVEKAEEVAAKKPPDA